MNNTLIAVHAILFILAGGFLCAASPALYAPELASTTGLGIMIVGMVVGIYDMAQS